MKLVRYQQPTCLCVKMEFVVGTISLSSSHFLKPGPASSRLQWDPAMVVGQVVHFCQIILALKN